MRKITFLLLSVFFVLSLASAADYENLYVVGNGCDAGWSPDDALEMTKEIDGTFIWIGDLTAGGDQRFKFLVARDWHPSITCRLDVEGHLRIESGVEYDLYVRSNDSAGHDNAFQVPENGEYRIVIDLTTMKIIITKIGDVEEPAPDLTQLYINGSALSADGEWDYDNPSEMTMTAEGVFTWTGDLYNAGEGKNEFKFKNIADSWDQTFCSTQEDITISAGEFDLNYRPFESSPDDHKFKVAIAGRYTITANLNTMKMTVATDNTGIKNLDVSNQIRVVGNTITILNSDNAVQSAAVYDITGKCLNVASNINGPIVLAENLTNGIYIVKIDYNGQKAMQKIMIK